MARRVTVWTEKDEQKIHDLWKKSKENRDEFKKLVMADKKFVSGKNWDAIRHKAIRMGLYDKAERSSRYPFSGLSEPLKEKLKSMLSDPKVGWEDIGAIKEFNDFTETQLRNFAKGWSISVQKGGAKVSRQENQEEKHLTPEQIAEKEKELIAKREAGEISVEDFLENLTDLKGEYADYWEVIKKQIEEKRTIRVRDLLIFAEKLNAKQKEEKYRLNFIGGILRKFEDWEVLNDFKKEGHKVYLCNTADFYAPEELFNLISENDKKLIADLLSKEPQDVDVLVKRVAKVISRNLLLTLLAYYENLGLVKFVKTANAYSLTERGQELGIDAQSIKTLEATALENQIFIKEEETGSLPQSLKEVGEALERDIAKKTVGVSDLSRELGNHDLKLLFVGEVMYGSQYTDQKLLDWILASVSNPTLVFTSGLVQGRFEIKNKAKTKMLAEESGLHKIESQFHTAGMLLDWLERIATSKVCVIQGDDDFRLAEDYGTLMHLAEGKNPWKFGVDWSSFSGEMKRRLENRELRRKIRIQWEIIQTYMYRIGRSLLNKKEVEAKIGVSKSEYRLIIEIMVAKRNNFDYPKEYEKVVNVAALYGNTDKRIVSPDPLRIKVSDGKEIRLVHNAGFSDITQYQKPIQHLDAIARHIGLSRQEMPWILADFHQENFFAEYLMGTWIMNMPGLQNTMPAATYTMSEWHTKILEAKERRQSRVRKEPVSPAGVEMHCLADGRIRFRIINNSVRKVIEEQKNEEEKREVAVIGTDLQFGSITMWPEFTAKFLDYGLYAKRATRCYLNGDIIHGSIYPQHNAESRDLRLTSLHAQQMFGFNLMMPLFLDAPALVDLAAWLGNHEWNNMSAKYQGDSPLTFLETGLQGVLMERKRAGTESPLKRAITVSRIRWLDTHNPQGDIVNWPFFADTICGFKVAIQHMWQPFGGEDTASDAKAWLKRMAKAARSIDILIGGHKHSVYMAQIADKVAVSAGASAGQSGYELARGLMSTVMFTLIEFSNKEGITVEFVPWQFLADYKFQCPAYKGKDELFVRPAEGTKEYKQGKVSPFINGMIDELTQYLKV